MRPLWPESQLCTDLLRWEKTSGGAVSGIKQAQCHNLFLLWETFGGVGKTKPGIPSPEDTPLFSPTSLSLSAHRDTLVIGIGNCCTSLLAGLAIFSVLGHMAWRKKVSVGRVADSGRGEGCWEAPSWMGPWLSLSKGLRSSGLSWNPLVLLKPGAVATPRAKAVLAPLFSCGGGEGQGMWRRGAEQHRIGWRRAPQLLSISKICFARWRAQIWPKQDGGL